MKVSELFEALGPKKAETLEGVEIFDPNNGEYNDDEKDGPNTYIGLRSADKSARSKTLISVIADTAKNAEEGMHWGTKEKSSLTVLMRGKRAQAISAMKKLITKTAKAIDAADTAKQAKSAARAEKGPSYPSASAEARKKMVEKYGKSIVDRVTVKQVGGDDGYQWAVLVDGRVRYGGMTKPEVPYQRELVYKQLKDKEAK